MAVAYASVNRFADAKKLFNEVLEEQPDFYDASIKLAVLYKTNGEYDTAIKIMEDVLSKSKKHTKYYEFVGELYHLKGDIDKSIDYYKKALEYYPDDIASHIALAQIFFEHIKDYKNATRMIRSAYKLKKDDVKINTLYALILSEDGYPDSALEKIDAAIALDENNLEIYLRKAYILKKSNYITVYNEFIDFIKNKFAEKTDYIQSVISSF